MTNFLWLAALAVALVYSVIQCILIFSHETPAYVVQVPPSPGIWDSICSGIQSIWHAIPYVVGGGIVVYLVLVVVTWVEGHFEQKKEKRESEREAIEKRFEELELKVQELNARKWQLSDAIAPYVAKASELEKKIAAIQSQLPAPKSETPTPKPAPKPKPDSAIKGQAVLTRVLNQMERGY